MTATATCPVCGQETVTIFVTGEMQGDPPMTGWMEFTEIDWSCGCELTDEQEDAIIESFHGN